ncbi:hypothetical protein D3C80_1807270 [compost metagenome]
MPGVRCSNSFSSISGARLSRCTSPDSLTQRMWLLCLSLRAANSRASSSGVDCLFRFMVLAPKDLIEFEFGFPERPAVWRIVRGFESQSGLMQH